MAVNYFGALTVSKSFEFGDKDYIAAGYDDFWSTEEHLTIREYMEKIKSSKAQEIFEYNGFHYVAVRTFNQEEKDMSLIEISKYLWDIKGTDIQGTYSYKVACRNTVERSRYRKVR